MKWKNKKQAQERLKLVLDRWIQAYELMLSEFYIDFDGDSDIAEWEPEEIDSGGAYVCVRQLTVTGDVPWKKYKEIHIVDVERISEILELPVLLEDWRSGGYKYQASIMYKGYKFFDLLDAEEYEKGKQYFYGEEFVDEK